MVAPSQITNKFPEISRVSICKKRTTSGPMSRMILTLHKDLSLRRNTANGREMVTGQFHAQNGCLATRRIRADCHWQQIKSRLVYEYECAFFVFGLFFKASQRCSFHVWIAASSRCVAFWMGFC
jgi:hypothetical protein